MLELPSTSSPPKTARALLELLERGGGSVQVADPPEEIRAAWRRLIHAVKQDDRVPEGWHLLHRGRNRGDLTIELRPGAHPCTRYRTGGGSQLRVPQELVNPHPIVDALRDQPHRLPASPQNRTRTLMIVQALVEAALSVGNVVKAGADEVLLTVVADGEPYRVRIWEETGARWTFRLVLVIDGAGEGKSRWSDYARRRIEDDLGEVLAELRRRAASVVAEREARQLAEQRRREQERQRALTDQRDRLLRAQVAAWRLAADIRGHCEELAAAGMSAEDKWLVWARAYADSIDPLLDPPGLPDDPNAAEEPTGQPPVAAVLTSSLVPVAKPWHPNRRWYHG